MQLLHFKQQNQIFLIAFLEEEEEEEKKKKKKKKKGVKFIINQPVTFNTNRSDVHNKNFM